MKPLRGATFLPDTHTMSSNRMDIPARLRMLPCRSFLLCKHTMSKTDNASPLSPAGHARNRLERESRSSCPSASPPANKRMKPGPAGFVVVGATSPPRVVLLLSRQWGSLT